jgi:hypothetical protein
VADSLRRFQVDNEFKSRWLLEGKIGRLCTDRVLAMLIVSAAHRTGAARLTRARYPPLGPACRATPAWRHRSGRWRGSWHEPLSFPKIISARIGAAVR